MTKKTITKNCFGNFIDLSLRVQPVNREKKKLKGKRKRTKARKRKPNRCSTPFTIASWGTGFRRYAKVVILLWCVHMVFEFMVADIVCVCLEFIVCTLRSLFCYILHKDFEFGSCG